MNGNRKASTMPDLLAVVFVLMIALMISQIWPGAALAADPPQPDLDTKQTERLIRLARPGLGDSKGWAEDILWALTFSGRPANAENVCAVIAIVDQETNFKVNPPVANMTKRAITALEDRLAESSLKSFALRSLFALDPAIRERLIGRIKTASTEKDLDLAYRALIEDVLRIETIIMFDGLGFSLADFLETQNEISTIGSMQVSVAAALDYQKRYLGHALSIEEIYEVRNYLYTRRGGLLNGIRVLLGYSSGYIRKIHRFADYNAGHYASRNAAFQQQLSQLDGKDLSLDGDLLIYRDRKPSADKSATEQAIIRIARTHGLGLTPKQIRDDLLREKKFDFVNTQTFLAIRALYRSSFDREPAFAVLPEIRLESVKIDRELSTAWFARKVYGRYRACMKRLER